jgi:hypothetical protein
MIGVNMALDAASKTPLWFRPERKECVEHMVDVMMALTRTELASGEIRLQAPEDSLARTSALAYRALLNMCRRKANVERQGNE